MSYSIETVSSRVDKYDPVVVLSMIKRRGLNVYKDGVKTCFTLNVPGLGFYNRIVRFDPTTGRFSFDFHEDSPETLKSLAALSDKERAQLGALAEKRNKEHPEEAARMFGKKKWTAYTMFVQETMDAVCSTAYNMERFILGAESTAEVLGMAEEGQLDRGMVLELEVV